MKSVEVNTKPLKAQWTAEMASDLSFYLDDDFLNGILNGILKAEIRRSKIKKIFKK